MNHQIIPADDWFTDSHYISTYFHMLRTTFYVYHAQNGNDELPVTARAKCSGSTCLDEMCADQTAAKQVCNDYIFDILAEKAQGFKCDWSQKSAKGTSFYNYGYYVNYTKNRWHVTNNQGLLLVPYGMSNGYSTKAEAMEFCETDYKLKSVHDLFGLRA